MAASSHFCYTLILLLICRASAAPLSSSKTSDPLCSSAQLVAPGQGSLVYKYKTEVTLSVANSQYDVKTEITANVHIKSLGDCNYALQLHNVKVAETKDEDEKTVTSSATAQRGLEKLIVRFRSVDGFLVAVEADESANVDHVNFIKGILSALQVYSPVPTDGENIVREEDVLGVCTTRYKYSQKSGTTQIVKNKDLSTCSKDKLHLSSSPVLTSLLGPLIEEVFASKTRYVCQTNIRDKKIQSVKCKTIEIDTDDSRKPAKKPAQQTDEDIQYNHGVDSSSEEADDEVDFNDKNVEEISSKHISIKQELTLQPNTVANVATTTIANPVRQTLQFVPTASFAKSTEAVSKLVSKIQELLTSKDWNQFAAGSFVDISNELRRMDKSSLELFKASPGLKHLVPTFLDTVYAHTPAASLLNLDPKTLEFANPLSVFYLDNPSKELVDQILQGASRLSASQIPDFVGLAATILKAYKARHENKDADAKIKQFQGAISRFLNNPSATSNVTTAILSAYAQLRLYGDQVRRLAANDQGSLEIQYHALNTIRHICEDNIDDDKQLRIRTDLQKVLLAKLKNKANKNAVRVWAFEALYTSFIYNPEEDDSTLGDTLEKELADILNEPLNQVNGFIWSALKYSSLDRLCPLRGLAARLRAHHDNKKQFSEQATLSSRQIHLDLPLRKNYRAVLRVCLVFENDRVVPSFVGAKLAFDGVRRETIRLPWIDIALINENLDWNFADYFLRLDKANKNKNVDDDYKENTKQNLPSGLKQLQDTHDQKEEDPDPSVHLYVKLFGADVRSSDVTDKVQDILRSNLTTFLRNRVLNRLKDVSGKDPIFRLPLEIGAASAAANGLTLYKSGQVGLLADLTTDLKTTYDKTGSGSFSITSRSVLSFSLTLQREISSPLTSVGETVQIGAVSNVPFEYTAEASSKGRIREFNLLNTKTTLLATDFQYSVRTSEGLEVVEHQKGATIDPSCTPSLVYRGLGIRACLELNPFRSIQLGSRPSYPLTITVSKEPSIKKWRIGWRIDAQTAPQYEVVVEKVGADATYPGLGISATKTGNNFNIKVLTGMKSFTVKGVQTGSNFQGKVYSNEDKEVMTTSGTLTVDSDGFKLDSKLFDSKSKKEVLTLTTDILPNRGQGLTADIGLTTPGKAKSFKIFFRGDLYKPNSKLIHASGSFNLGDVTYAGKVHLQNNDNGTRIELQRTMKLSESSLPSGYELFYERKKTKGTTQKRYDITSHVSLQTPERVNATKVFNLKADFTRKHDLSNATLHGKLDFLLLTRNPPVSESITLDYIRRSVRTTNQARRLVSPEAKLKIQLTTRSKVLNVLIDHQHRRSSEASQKGPESLPPTLDVANKIHIVADSDKLFPDIPRPFAFEVLSDLDFELLNSVNYTFKYDLPQRQRSALFTYQGQVDKVTNGHLFSGTSTSKLRWDNNTKTATGKGDFTICTQMRTLKTHWDIDTNLVKDKNDIELDLNVRFDRQPKKDSPNSFIGLYNVTIKAPKHEAFQLIDLDGNVKKQTGTIETYNSIAYRVDKSFKEINLNLVLDRDETGDGALQSHIAISLPFKYLPYITHDLVLERVSRNGPLSHVASRLIAKPVFSHYVHVDINRSKANQPPYVHVDNEIEYLRANGDSLHGISKVDVSRWSILHSFGLLKRNADLLHKHSIGYIFSNKTRKVALSLDSPQLSGNPLSIIGELTIDRENRIGKMKWPQEFGVHLEFGTPLSNLTALQVFYNLPMFHKDDDQTVDASVGFKLASSNIAPISFYLHSEGSLNTTLHLTKSLNIGDDISLSTLLTAQYNPQSISQISASTSSKYYEQEFDSSIYALFKQHQVTVRGILNTTDKESFKYEMDIGFDNDLLLGHTERTDGEQKTVSDIDANKCSSTGKYKRCYTGDITLRTSNSGSGRKGTFDVSWGRGIAKLDVRIPDQIELKFNHTHTGHLRDEDFNSATNIEGKLLQLNNRGSFSYSGSVEKEDGKWNNVQLRSVLTDKKTGQKSLGADIRLNQQITDKLTGKFQRKISVNLEQKGQPVINWSSRSASCANNPSNVLYGICQTTSFDVKANTQFVQRLRQRFQLPTDPKLSSLTGQVNYNGTLKLDLKHDPQSGPHTVKLDLNRLQEDAVDLDVSYQARYDNEPMNLRLKANLPKQPPLSVNYDETRKSSTSFQGILKYSFNAKDKSAEKTYTCDVDRKNAEDVSVNCKGERTTLTLDIDRKAGESKAYIDLNQYPGQRIGYEGKRNAETKELDATLYTLITQWNLKRQPGKSIIVTATQKGEEVLRVEGTKVNNRQIQVKFSPSSVNLKLTWDNSTVIKLEQTSPRQRNLVTITIDRSRIRHYLPSLRAQNRPAYDIDQPVSTSQQPLVEIAFDSHIFLSLSQAIDKIGSHNGLYGLDTIKKSFKLQLGDAPLTVYNTQHWKTHQENFELPESYSIRIVNNANGNIVQVTTNKWNENRLISKISHSFDGGRTLTTDLKLDRDYAHQVGSVFFFDSLGYRNVQGVKQLRNYTRQFLRDHLKKDLNRTNAAELLKDLRKRLRSFLENDYKAVKDIASAWNQEPANSFLRRFSNRLGLLDFFGKYPTYSAASDRFFAILRERSVEREEFWRNRIATIMNDNRIKDLAERLQTRRTAFIKRLLDRSEKLLDRLLPKVDQANVDKRIADYVGKLVTGFEQVSKRNTEQWKAVFKAIGDASEGESNKWFRILVADIDSNTFATAADAESAKVIKKLHESSKLLINNIQQISRGITKRREAIRGRVRNAILHVPKAYINDTNFELLFPLGREPGSYVGMSELLLGLGSLLRNRDQAVDTIRSILQTRSESRMETSNNYFKALRSLFKRLLKRNPSLTPEYTAVIAETGDAINVHGDYIHLNPSCDVVLAHDFADLQFSFGLKNGKVYSFIPKEEEIKEYECSNTSRVQMCSFGNYYTLNVPMYYGGRVNGALGDVRDRTGAGLKNLERWSLQDCQPQKPSKPSKGDASIVGCASADDDEQEFCENFVLNGVKKGLDRRQLIAQAMEARKQAT